MAPRTIGLALATVALWATVAQAEAIVYLSRDGIDLRPGKDNSQNGTSSLITAPATVGAWETTPEVWAETVACVRAIYAPFDVTITEDDPGDAPYIHAVLGGSPKDLGLPRSYAGVSPFSGSCGVIERSIVFAFTDVLPADDAEYACHVIAQEIGHSFGLDHELADRSPMSTANKRGPRAFLDEDVACGETTARPCGLPKQTCRATQNSYALLAERMGLAGDPDATARAAPDEVGCNAGRADRGILVVGALLAALSGRGRTRASSACRRRSAACPASASPGT